MILFSAIAYNLPKLCRNASWNPDATTAVTSTQLGYSPSSIFLTKNNKWYAAPFGSSSIRSGVEGSIDTTTNALGAWSVFVAGDDSVYAFSSTGNQVNRWSMNLTSSQPVMSISNYCQGLFVDTNNRLYCSIAYMFQVVSKSLDDSSNTLKIVAGTGTAGSAANQLNYAYGIFVDSCFTLYVADPDNHRIQRFWSGQMNATTIAGTGAPNTIPLSSLSTAATIVLLDRDPMASDVSQAVVVHSDLHPISCHNRGA
jgi:hypothetical protein